MNYYIIRETYPHNPDILLQYRVFRIDENNEEDMERLHRFKSKGETYQLHENNMESIRNKTTLSLIFSQIKDKIS